MTIDIARKAAAKHLANQGFVEEAAIVTAGRGDDFVEVRIAMSLFEIIQSDNPVSSPRFVRRLVGEEC